VHLAAEGFVVHGGRHLRRGAGTGTGMGSLSTCARGTLNIISERCDVRVPRGLTNIRSRYRLGRHSQTLAEASNAIPRPPPVSPRPQRRPDRPPPSPTTTLVNSISLSLTDADSAVEAVLKVENTSAPARNKTGSNTRASAEKFALVKPGGGTSMKGNRRDPHTAAAAVVAAWSCREHGARVKGMRERVPGALTGEGEEHGDDGDAGSELWRGRGPAGGGCTVHHHGEAR
jgi:hypothetical protein